MTSGLLIDYGSGDYTVGDTIPVAIPLSGEPSAGVTLECHLTVKGSLIDPYLDFDNFTFNGIGVETEPPPPECEYEVTGSGGITSTATISTSLLTNGSFESGFASWSMIGDHWLAGPLDGVSAYDGNWTAYRSELDIDSGALCQTFSYTTTVSSLRVTGYVRGSGRNVDLALDGTVLAEGTTGGEWSALDGSVTAGDGVSTVCLYTDAGLYGTDYFDDFSVIPLDAAGDVMCLPPEDRMPPEEPPPTPEPTPTPGPSPTPFPTPDPGEDNYPFPEDEPGEGVVCLQCVRPGDWYAFGQWIRWLGCHLSNLFKCYLYIWLLNLSNFVRGVWEWTKAGFVWVAQAAQSVITWFASTLSELFNYGWWAFKTQLTLFFYSLVQRILESDFVQAIWAAVSFVHTLWAVFIALVDVFIDILQAIYNAAIAIIEMILDILRAIWEAFGVEPYTTADLFGDVDISGPFSEAGPSTAKVVWLILSSMTIVDQLMAHPAIVALMYVVMGIMSLMVAAWTLKQFQDIIPA